MTEALLDNSVTTPGLAAETQTQKIADNPIAEQPSDTDVLSGETSTDWRTSIPEEYREDPSLQNFKEVGDLAKSYVHAQKTIGKKFEDLSPEEMDSYFTKMGRPESVEGYKFESSEGQELDQGTLDWFKGAAHDAGLNNDAADKILGQYLEYEQTQVSKQQALFNQEVERQKEQVKDMFGADFDNKVNYANKALRELGGDEAVSALSDAGLSSNPAVVRMLANMGELISEGGLANSSNKIGHAMTPEQAQESIATKMQDPEFLKRWKDPIAPGHASAIKELEELYRVRGASR